MKLHFTNDWLREKIASDPDGHEPEAGAVGAVQGDKLLTRLIRNEAAFHHLLTAAQQSVSNDDPKTLHDGIREALALSHGESPAEGDTHG